MIGEWVHRLVHVNSWCRAGIFVSRRKIPFSCSLLGLLHANAGSYSVGSVCKRV